MRTVRAARITLPFDDGYALRCTAAVLRRVTLSESVTVLLERANDGDAVARNRLFEMLYADLHRRAHAELARHRQQTLSTTALVHEAYLKLFDKPLSLASRAHFFHLAALVMRQVLVDAARERIAQKRGGDAAPITLTGDLGQPDSDPLPLVDLDRALTRLARFEPKLAKLTELHVFAGLEFGEIAQLLGTSERSIYRDWRLARVFLRNAMSHESS
jgi:RNA polymerase sigma factor (TIGR02999 family)